MQPSATSPEQLLAALPDDVREDMVALDKALSGVFAGHDRVVWEGVMWGGPQWIIGYGTYHYRGRSGAEGDWFVVGLAAPKGHLSLHVSGAEDGEPLIKRYGPGLGKVKLGSGVATFRRLADVDLDAIVDLATRARDWMLATA